MLAPIVSADANQDLDRIWDDIAENSPDAAERTVVELTGKFQLFQQMPEAGRARPEL